MPLTPSPSVATRLLYLELKNKTIMRTIMKTNRLAIAFAAITASAGVAFAQTDPFAAAPEAHAAAHADHAREFERALVTSQNALQVAQAHGGTAANAPRAIAVAGGARKGSAGRALIIPKDASDVKALAEVEEDMNVMAHILDKAISDEKKSGRAMGIPVYGRFGWGGGTSPQNLFIEGSGALFFLNVNDPLQPAPDKDSSAEAKEKPASEWETAKKEMTAPRTGSADNFFAYGDSFSHAFVWEDGSSTPYDAGKVEDLKADLIPALKNVANIRRLKSDDTVTVVVIGTSALPAGRTIKAKPDDKGAWRRQEELLVIDAKSGERAPAPAKLVLRVKKSDADAFQNGKLSVDDFKKKVTVMNY